MDKGITRLSKDPGAAPNPFDALVEDLAERIARKLRENTPVQTNSRGVNWMTMGEVAEKTGISYQSITIAVRTGELPAYTPMGRKLLDPLEVDEWVRKYHTSTTMPDLMDSNLYP